MQHCPNCRGGELKIIAAILERPVIEKILTHLGLDPQPPPGEGGRAWRRTTEAAWAAPVGPDTRHINTGCAAFRQPQLALRRMSACGLPPEESG